jgi:hypothetical protein
MANDKLKPALMTGKAPKIRLTDDSVTELKRAGSWESARIAGQYLKARDSK